MAVLRGQDRISHAELQRESFFFLPVHGESDVKLVSFSRRHQEASL